MYCHRLVLVGLVAAFGVFGCEREEGPGEELGESLDEAGESIQGAAENAGDAVEEACENVEEGMEAEDRDC